MGQGRAFEHARANLTVQDARAKHAAIDGVAEFSNGTLNDGNRSAVP